jgi:hypothetical protein
LIITFMFEPAKLQMNCASASGTRSLRVDTARSVVARPAAAKGACTSPCPASAPHRAPGGAGQALTLDSAAATANPRTVARPAKRPALPRASGIIESVSMTRSAPAANPSIAAWRSPPVASAIA